MDHFGHRVSWPIFKKKQNPGDPLRIQNKTRQGESMAYLCIYMAYLVYFFSCIYIFHGNVYLIFPYVSSCQIRCFQAPGSGMHTSTCWWQRLGGRFPHPKRRCFSWAPNGEPGDMLLGAMASNFGARMDVFGFMLAFSHAILEAT